VLPSIGFFTRFRPASAPERSFLSYCVTMRAGIGALPRNYLTNKEKS